MEPADIGTWFDNECQAPTEDQKKHIGRCNKDTKSLIEEYKEKRRQEEAIHKRKKKE
jgi:hypothetical protein